MSSGGLGYSEPPTTALMTLWGDFGQEGRGEHETHIQP